MTDEQSERVRAALRLLPDQPNVTVSYVLLIVIVVLQLVAIALLVIAL